MPHLRKECAKCGRPHTRECRHDTKPCFSCGKSGHMGKDCPQKEVRLEVMLNLVIIHRI